MERSCCFVFDLSVGKLRSSLNVKTKAYKNAFIICMSHPITVHQDFGMVQTSQKYNYFFKLKKENEAK